MTSKSDLIAGIADDSGQTKLVTTAVLEALENIVLDKLSAGDEVKLLGLGKFTVKDVPARNARNPRTGEPIRTSPKRKATFKPSKTMMEAL